MAVFRVEKTRDYTVMSNYHLRDKSLSLKAKGLLSLMLSLPEDWDYTTKGLAAIRKEGIECIRATVRELERYGYVQRRQIYDCRNRITAVEYTIWEKPPSPELENPILDNPVQDNLVPEKQTQINKEESSKELTNKDL